MRHINVEIPQDKIAGFCRRRKITEIALFGSVLRDDFGPESDIDVLITFTSDARHSLFDLVAMQDELQSILSRKVDLIEKAVLRNPFRRQELLKRHRACLSDA